ncbi:major facilitator superfamily domain-containing protein [Bisporella sp. PMI_857]|nr:major facilitator superfamily domain-containing protein [Bisporella sp. PMI_857]
MNHSDIEKNALQEGGSNHSSSDLPDAAVSDVTNTIKANNGTNLVDFEGPDDPYMPLNWPRGKKILNTILYSFCTMGSTWASSVFTPAVPQVEKEFDVGLEVGLLGMTLFLLGNGFGPLLFAPVSEAYGRKISVLVPGFLGMVFSFATATSKDIQTVLITRFFAGVFASAPITNSGGVMADIWPPQHRGAALLVYGIAVVTGPLIAPLVAGALVLNMHHVGWRWTEYVTGILLAVIIAAGVFFIDESYPPVLLSRKANKIRQETKNWAIHSKLEETDLSFGSMARKYLIVPLEMCIDPICFFINLYAAFCYAIIFLYAVPSIIEFQEKRGWNSVVGSLPFMGQIIGIIFGGAILIWSQTIYVKRMIANNNKPVPEARLIAMMIGSFFFAAGLFIMGWTSDKDIHWIGFCVGAACLALGFFAIFQSAISYLVDTYLMLAASALAANMLLRSVLAAAFPLFATAMFHNLGSDWAFSLLGFLAVAMIPIPFLFYIFGERIRAKGKRSAVSL